MGFYTGHETLYDYVTQPIPDGEHTFQTVVGAKAVDIDVEFYNFTDNTVYTADPLLGNGTPDTRMLVLKYHKDLTVEQFVKMTPQVRKKGMLIYVQGNLHNKGIISMTARGASAEGQDVYLWGNGDGTHEYVPAVGGLGGDLLRYNVATSNGHPGLPSIGSRGTGGGGGGARNSVTNGSTNPSSARGGKGTSYSGGSGGGAFASGNTSMPATLPTEGSDTGGAGGTSGHTYNSMTIGGVGNPGGKVVIGRDASAGIVGASGTGGLLIIYCDRDINLDFNSSVESKGVSNTATSITRDASGGSSGGGSINIFHVGNITVNSTPDASGGALGSMAAKGGQGGVGAVTLQQITIPQNAVKFLNRDSKPLTAMDLGHSIQGAYGEIKEFTAENVYILPIKNLTVDWEYAATTPTKESELEFSKTIQPFVAERPLVFPDTLEYRDRVTFYVRAKSGIIQTEQNHFEITATVEGA